MTLTKFVLPKIKMEIKNADFHADFKFVNRGFKKSFENNLYAKIPLKHLQKRKYLKFNWFCADNF